MGKLLIRYLKDAQKILLPVFGISVLFGLLSLALRQVDNTFFQNVSTLFASMAILIGAANVALGAYLWSGKTFKETFFTGPATLYRTLPLSRTQLLEACLFSALIVFIESLFFLFCILCLFDWQTIPALISQLPEITYVFGWFIATLLVEGICGILVIDLGFLIGYRFQSSKFGWSIFFMLVIWMITSLIVGLGMAPSILQNFEALDVEIFPISALRQLMWIGTLVYGGLDLLYLILIWWQVKRGVDIDS